VATKIAAPVVEKGYVNASGGAMDPWGGALDQFERVEELTWPYSVWTYARMAREDARIASVLRAVGLPIRRTRWWIAPNGARPEVVEHVARDLGLPIEDGDDDEPRPRTRGRFSWHQHLQQALMCQQFGHAVFEQVYDRELLRSTGRAHLKKLAPRPQSSISYWNVDRDGGLISIQQWPPGTFSAAGMVVMSPASMGDAIPVDRLVVYLRDPDPGVWTGNSLLRPAYKHWKLKDELMRIEAAAARRNGIGVPGFTASETESQDQDRLNKYATMATQYRGGESAGFSIPNGATFKLYGVEGNLPDLRQAIEYHDRQMGMVALAHFLNLDGKGGSYALASVQADTFIQSVQTVAEDIRDTGQAHVVEDIVDVNWGPDEPAPLLMFDEIGSRQDATAAALQMLVGAGLLTPDPRLESFIRQATGLPGPDPDAPPPDEETDPDAPEGERDEQPSARMRPRGRSPKDRRKNPDGAMKLW
jgi:hypothetical protein